MVEMNSARVHANSARCPDIIVVGMETVPIMVILWTFNDFSLWNYTEWDRDSCIIGILKCKWRVILNKDIEGGIVRIGVGREEYSKDSDYWCEIDWLS